MNIVIGSAFRNSRHNLPRYFEQVDRLRAVLSNHVIRVIAIEGDSTDGTYEALQRYNGTEVIKCDHGGPVFGSTESPDRLTALSKVGNAIFDAVRVTDDVLVYVESDLIWNAQTVRRLIEHAVTNSDFDVVAPMIFAGEAFYDIWGYRGLDGQRFSPLAPYHDSLVMNGLTELSSVGSCLVMTGKVARAARIRDNNCLVGWCADARAKGYRIAVHSGLRVNHP